MKKLLLCILMASFMMPAIAQEGRESDERSNHREHDSLITVNAELTGKNTGLNGQIELLQKEKDSWLYYGNIISIVLGVISIFLAMYVFKWSIKQTDKQTLVLDEHSKDLKGSLRDIDNIRQNMFTTDIPDFPDNIQNIINLMDECLKKKTCDGKRIEFEIFTDFPGYGMLSYNDEWNGYKEKIRQICSRRRTRWYFYNDEKQAQQIAHQFEHFKGDENRDKLIEFIDKCQKNALIGHIPDCCDIGHCPYDKDDKKEFKCPLARKRECYYIKTMDKSYESLMQKTIELQQSLKETIAEMVSQHYIEVTRMDKELPFFGWFIVEKIENERIPLKAIITFPVWGQNCEKGFYTEKEKLLYAFYNTLHEHVKVDDTSLKLENRLLQD